MSAASAEVDAAAKPAGTTWLDRALAAVPVALAAVLLLAFYCVEAWLRKTPWVFTDELEWTQISRAISETGHAARRGHPVGFKSLYAVLIAPIWWIHSTATAYAVIKYVNAVVMTLAAVPTYLLARMLVPRRTAIVVALLAVLIPGMSYATSLVPEVLAYPWYAVCSWLIVRALTTCRRRDLAIAAAASVVATLVRWPQFATVPASFVIAGAAVWITGPSGRRLRAGWSRGDTLGALVLLVGALLLFNRVVLQHVHEWQVATQYWKGRMVDLGLKAGLALTVGMGILPVLGGFASLRLPERRGQPAYRAFAVYLAASMICISLYTGVKGAYLSTIFSTLTEERNMIYLSPLLLLGTALALGARRIDWRIVAAASAFVLFLVFAKPPNLLYPYFEAPGFGILNAANRHFYWDVTDLRLALVATLAVSLAVLRFRAVRGVAAAAAVAGAAWMMTSEISATAGSTDFANRFREHLPAQLDWIDRTARGRPVTYLGQAIVDPNGLWETEFWNRSIKHVDSLDGSAPGPGPTYAPNVTRADGKLSGLDGVPLVVADSGVVLQARKLDRWNQLTLYERTGPWRLLDSFQQVYNDGWAPGWSSYTYFKTGQRGTLVVSISREGFNGDAPLGHVRLLVGTVKVVDEQAELAHVFARRRTVVRNGPGSAQTFRIPVARTPVRAELYVTPTFHAGPSDPRDLGAQVGFRFVPAR
ncbi:MAG TPA: glycosyltransferase family 39 protein [Gaiellaceae bacterium]|nr:glycosyltransferase family 39 protein [Gaiellaceae bacterium]